MSSRAFPTKNSTPPPSSISHRDEIIINLLLLRMNNSFNDVKIVLSDGCVLANSFVLSSASDYFATMLSSDTFVEGQTYEVIMEEYVSKEAMERVVHYIYSGDMNMEEIGFERLLEIMNISKMLLMRTDSLFNSLEAHIISIISQQWTTILDVLRGFILVERYCLDSLRKHIVNDIYTSIPKFAWNIIHMQHASISATLQQFKFEMIKEILLYEYDPADPTVRKGRAPSSKNRLQFFQVWYSGNKDCKAEEKKMILDSINLDEFTGEELLTKVKESGLFSDKEIDKKCIEKFRKTDQ